MYIFLLSYICHPTFLANWTQFQVNNYIKCIGETPPPQKKKRRKKISLFAEFQNGKPNNIVWHNLEYKAMYGSIDSL